jgi:hypothetical protein
MRHELSAIIECHHLREVGIIHREDKCCPHCHTDAGLVFLPLPNGYKAIFCCAGPTQFTDEEVAKILTMIPAWEREMNGY